MVRGGGGGGATLVVGDVSKLMSFSVGGDELPKFKVSLSPPWIEKKTVPKTHTQNRQRHNHPKYVLGLLTTETNVALDMSGTSLGGGDSP